MKITVNGKSRRVEAPGGALPLLEFLRSNQINPRLVAVGMNGNVVQRDSYATAVVRDGDVLEIVRMVGGGAR